MTAYATSTMLFGCVVWGHIYGAKLSLRDGPGGAAAQMGVLFRSALRWAIQAPADMRGAALYLLAHTLPLQGLIIK